MRNKQVTLCFQSKISSFHLTKFLFNVCMEPKTDEFAWGITEWFKIKEQAEISKSFKTQQQKTTSAESLGGLSMYLCHFEVTHAQ